LSSARLEHRDEGGQDVVGRLGRAPLVPMEAADSRLRDDARAHFRRDFAVLLFEDLAKK
jgi:hypothetical protein